MLAVNTGANAAGPVNLEDLINRADALLKVEVDKTTARPGCPRSVTVKLHRSIPKREERTLLVSGLLPSYKGIAYVLVTKDKTPGKCQDYHVLSADAVFAVHSDQVVIKSNVELSVFLPGRSAPPNRLVLEKKWLQAVSEMMEGC